MKVSVLTLRRDGRQEELEFRSWGRGQVDGGRNLMPRDGFQPCENVNSSITCLEPRECTHVCLIYLKILLKCLIA